MVICPSITVERHQSDPDSYVISDGEQSVELGRSADMPLGKALLSQVLRESFGLEEFTKQSGQLLKLSLVAGEPDYEYCLRLLSGQCEERFCVARRQEDCGAEYLCVRENGDYLWIDDPLADDIALFLAEADAQLVVEEEADRLVTICKRHMLKG